LLNPSKPASPQDPPRKEQSTSAKSSITNKCTFVRFIFERNPIIYELYINYGILFLYLCIPLKIDCKMTEFKQQQQQPQQPQQPQQAK